MVRNPFEKFLYSWNLSFNILEFSVAIVRNESHKSQKILITKIVLVLMWGLHAVHKPHINHQHDSPTYFVLQPVKNHHMF